MIDTKTGTADICGAGLNCGIIQSDIDGDELIGYTTYGIKITRVDGTDFLEVKDISTDRDFVRQFILLLEEKGVSGVHILDVLEDYMP